MDEKTAYLMLRELMNKHGLSNWSVGFNNRKNSFGVTNIKHKKIILSKHFIKYYAENEIRNTILHEIAHAIQYERSGYLSHDFSWKSIARNIGLENPKTTTHISDEYRKNITSKYTLICFNCGMRTPVHRKLKRKYVCSLCKKKGIKSLLKLQQNY